MDQRLMIKTLERELSGMEQANGQLRNALARASADVAALRQTNLMIELVSAVEVATSSSEDPAGVIKRADELSMAMQVYFEEKAAEEKKAREEAEAKAKAEAEKEKAVKDAVDAGAKNIPLGPTTEN